MQSEKPAAGTMVARNSSVQLNLISATVIRKMPDFRGSSVRIAASFFLSAGIPFQVVGSGKVVSQFPGAGQPIEKGIAAVINCDNRSVPPFVGISSENVSGMQQ